MYRLSGKLQSPYLWYLNIHHMFKSCCYKTYNGLLFCKSQYLRIVNVTILREVSIFFPKAGSNKF